MYFFVVLFYYSVGFFCFLISCQIPENFIWWWKFKKVYHILIWQLGFYFKWLQWNPGEIKCCIYNLMPDLKMLDNSSRRTSFHQPQPWNISFEATAQIFFCAVDTADLREYLTPPSVFISISLCLFHMFALWGEVTWGNQGNNEPPPGRTTPPNSTSPPPFPLTSPLPSSPFARPAGWERMPHPGSIKQSQCFNMHKRIRRKKDTS